jgi:chemotaxis protein histidine kinase CheA
LEGIVAERTAQITTILNNVRTGFLLVGRDLKVEEGFSRACFELFGAEFKPGVPFLSAIGMENDRNFPMWQAFLEQAFDDFLPEEMTLQQLPARISYRNRVLAMEAAPVRNAENQVACILFTFHDATKLEIAEEASRHHQLLVRLLREVDAFKDFVEETKTRLSMCRRFIRNAEQGKVRAELHTVKGNTAAYDLVRIAKLVHEIEDRSTIANGDIDEIETAMREFLDSTYEVLQMSYDSTADDSYTVTKADLRLISDRLHAAQGDLSALEKIRDWVDSVQNRPAKVFIGALPDYAHRLAERLCKKVQFQMDGGETKMDPELMKPVMQSLVHLVRNAIDHGIENDGAREQKPEIATVKLKCGEEQDAWFIHVSDDGQGIDTDRLVSKAIDSGLITKEQAIKMSGAERRKLIFRNGLSTSSEVSDISGRGVGMGAVEAAVRECGGTLEISSERGVGTTIAIRVPKPGFAAVPTKLVVNS